MANRIKELREARGMTQQQVADRLGMHLTNYNKLENSKTRLNDDRLAKLAEVFIVEPVSIIYRLPETRIVRVMGAVQAGVFAESWELPEDEQYLVTIPDDATFRGSRLFAAETRGPSMDKVYPQGTVIVFTDFIDHPEQPTFGKRYIVERERADGLREHTVKTLWRDAAGKAWLIPESNDPLFQEPIPLDGEDGDTVRILGRVVYSVRRE